MPLHVETPNTHALFDPEWARDVVARHYRAQIELHREIVRYAADLALRALASALSVL
jgi:hypothetical protein